MKIHICRCGNVLDQTMPTRRCPTTRLSMPQRGRKKPGKRKHDHGLYILGGVWRYPELTVDLRAWVRCPTGLDAGQAGGDVREPSLARPMLATPYRFPALPYHSAYERVALMLEESLPLDRLASAPVAPRVRCVLKLDSRSNHIPPFFRLSSALAFLAASTSGASVLSGSAVWMNGCYNSVS